MFPSFRVFWISIIALIISLILLAIYLYYSCLANTACSGEYGIVFVMLGLPWIMYPSFGSLGIFGAAGVALLINIIILSFVIQILGWGYHFFSRSCTSSPPML